MLINDNAFFSAPEPAPYRESIARVVSGRKSPQQILKNPHTMRVFL